MNPCLPLHRHPKLSINPLAPQRLWHSLANCAWDFSYSCFSRGCSAKWEAAEQDTILPTTVPGEAVLGAEVPGEEEVIEAFHPEASPQVEEEVFGVLECEEEAAVVAQDARINR